MAHSNPIVMLARDGQSTRILYHALRSRFPVAAAILEEPLPRSALLRRRMRKLGVTRVSGQVLFQLLAVPCLAASSRGRARRILEEHRLDDRPIPPGEVLRVPSANCDETIAALRKLTPGLVVINGTRIIAHQVLESVPCPFINMHAGITPLYRGVHGAYWALTQGDRDACGVTVHLVDTGIDTGGILAQASITPTRMDNFTTYPLLQLAVGVPLLLQAVDQLLKGEVSPQPAPPGVSHLWSHPTLWEYLRYRLVRGVC